MTGRAVLLTVAATLVATLSVANAATEDLLIRCHTIPLRPSSNPGPSPRVVADRVGGVPMLVLLPASYETSTARYPVVYLLQGGVNHMDCYLGKTDLIAFTASQPADRQAIVVMPDVTSGPAWAGRANRREAERFWTHALLPHIDTNYRTIPHRSYRAIAGFSAGGLGALHLAARHPDAIGVVAGLSAVAVVDETDLGIEALGIGASLLVGAPNPFAEWGNPVTEPMGWHGENPAELAPNYGRVSVSLFSGNGVPCDNQDLGVEPVLTFWPTMFWAGEAGIRSWTLELSDALEAAGIAHTLDVACGVHSYRHVQQDLHAWWGPMFESFGRAAPASFDFRSGDARFSQWGWRFAADPERAPEFLDITDASCSGLGLKGSGRTSVRTASCFTAGSTVALTGAIEQAAVADVDGRITLHVDLGHAHRLQQFTLAQRLADALGDYFVTREVRFEIS